MFSIDIVREFIGWCTVINIGILLIATIFLVLTRAPILKIHAKLFELSQADLSLSYFQFLGQYTSYLCSKSRTIYCLENNDLICLEMIF